MATLERTYTVPLRQGFRKSPKYYRTNRAVTTLRAFLARHMKAPDDKIAIGQHLNEELWRNGIRHPPARVSVTVRKFDDGTVQAELAGKTYKGAIKPEARREEPQGIKERLQAAVGGKKEATPEALPDETPAEPAPEKSDAPVKKTVVKKAARKVAKKTAKAPSS